MAINSLVALVLVLDFSGSMSQKLGSSTKSEDLKIQSQSLLSALEPDSPVSLLTFGADPSRGCFDISTRNLTAASSQVAITKMNPGAFGKTPLAGVLRHINESFVRQKATRVVLMTDGADTCGENACNELDRLEENLRKQNAKIDLVAVGYDLKGERKEFDCFKKKRSPALKVRFLDIEKPEELQLALSEAWADQEENRLLETEKQVEKEIKTAAESSRTGPEVRSENRDKFAGANAVASALDNKLATKKNGSMMIDGADVSDEFEVVQKKRVVRKWFGGLAAEFAPGKYLVRYKNQNGKTIALELKPGEKVSWVLADFMVQKTESLALDEGGLGFDLTPQLKTSRMHRNLKAISVLAQPNVDPILLSDLPLGVWDLKVSSPRWLKDRLPTQSIHSQLGQKFLKYSPQIIKDVIWVENNRTDQSRVIEILVGGTKREAYLITVGQKRIPIHASDKWRWLY